MSRHSTAASGSTCSSIRSASRCMIGARPAGPSAAQAGNAASAARSARSASRSPPRAMCAMTCSSIGEMSAKRSGLDTRSPPMK